MFFNPAQAQSQINNPLFQQMMQQMQGSGVTQNPQGMQGMNMAPQLPIANQAQGAGSGMAPSAQSQGQAAQPGFFGQMLQSPQNMQSGLSSLSKAASIPSMIGSMGTEAAGPMLGGGAGYMTGGSGMMGGIGDLLGFLGL